MKKIIVFAFPIIASLASCTTKNNDVQPQQRISSSMSITLREGEDDERKILMKIFNGDLAPLQYVIVSATNGADTITGETNTEGRCLFSFPHPGKWDLTIMHPEYTTVHEQIELTDAMDEITFFMEH